MGVKSTKHLTREEGESLYWDLYERINKPCRTIPFSDTTLENLLESMNDQVNNGEGFTNYLIKR